MGKGNAQRLKIWPNNADGIEIEVAFCHSDYELQTEESVVASSTKLLRLFSLLPKDSSNPTFFGRYDARDHLSGRHGASAVDVDAQGLTNAEEVDFKAGKSGFSGHHSTEIEDGRHQILIATPKQGRLFEGILSMKATARGEVLEILDIQITDHLRVFNQETGEILVDSQSDFATEETD
ncbi:MAG: hypothetical protein RB191_05805 [Terriglobia bacterium]|nr:hypothetical protein [Terriglobia bacterium]